jgi:protein tyrosine/serine phosphatase
MKKLKTLIIFISFFLTAFTLSSHIAASDLTTAQKEKDFILSAPLTVALPEGAKISEKIYGLAGLENVGRIAPDIYRGSQPVAEGYNTLKKMGIKTVINMRARHSEKEAVESAGMKYVEFSINMLKDVKEETVWSIIDAMNDPSNKPLYIHCALGQDRTGIIAAIYRMEVQGWSSSEAEKEMQDFGFNDMWINLKKFVRNYEKEKQKQNF